jgi:hypothetical protein
MAIMSVAKPFRNLLEDIGENAADIIIIVIGIVILYVLFKIGGALWGGIQGLLGSFGNIFGGGGGGQQVGVPSGGGAPGPTGQPIYYSGGGTQPISGTPTPGQILTYPSGQQVQTVIGGKGMNFGYPIISPTPTAAPAGAVIYNAQPSYPAAYGGGATYGGGYAGKIYTAPIPYQGGYIPPPSIPAYGGVVPRGAAAALSYGNYMPPPVPLGTYTAPTQISGVNIAPTPTKYVS